MKVKEELMSDQPTPEHPWLESDDEFEGVGAHPDNPRYDHAIAVADQQAAQAQDDDAQA